MAEDRLHDRQDAIWQHVTFDTLNQFAHIRTLNLGDLAVPPRRQNMHLEPPLLQLPTLVSCLLLDRASCVATAPNVRSTASVLPSRFQRCQNALSGIPGGR
jgi:hypothetical protein